MDDPIAANRNAVYDPQAGLDRTGDELGFEDVEGVVNSIYRRLFLLFLILIISVLHAWAL